MLIFNDIIGKKLINVRDIGGYKTVDGKEIVKGRLFRGGRIEKLPKRSVDIIKKLGIKTIIDLRTPAEYSDHPSDEIEGITRLRLPTVTTVAELINDEKTMRLTMKRESKRLFVEFDSVKDYMAQTYRAIVFNDEPKESLKRSFREIIETDDPILWHCNSGKDRTGIFSMLLESVLGVDEKDIYTDYLYSNKRLFLKHVFLTFLLTIMPIGKKFKKFLIGYLRVKKEYLETIIKEITDKYGSVIAYCEEELGVTACDRVKLKSKYLTERKG